MIKRLPLGDEIANHLRDRILKGELQAGYRLTENGVAAEMGTSPGPVREAFAALARDGLVISLPHRGTFVSAVSEQEAKAAYDLRAWIEPHVMEQAFQKLPGALIQELRQTVTDMRAASQRSDFAALMAADLEFHGRLYEFVGGQMLANVWRVIQVTILKFAVVASPQYYEVRDIDAAVAGHERLLDLLQRGDLQELRRVTSEHLGDLWKRIQAARAAHGRTARIR